MLALIQRVSSASVNVDGSKLAEIDKGLLVFLGVEKNDDQAAADKLVKKVLSYRVFPDDEEKMNLSILDIQGGLLIVSQFTLAADTNRGLRPSFSTAKEPQEAEQLYEYFIAQAKGQCENIGYGKFGADMQVDLVNDGPVTFLLKS